MDFADPGETPVCRTRIAVAFLVLLGCWLTLAASANAALLNVTKPAAPRPITDVTSDFVKASYNSTTEVFSLTATPITIDYDNIAPPDYNLVDDGISQVPTLTLSFLVDHSGNLLYSYPLNHNVDLVVTGAVDTNNDTVMDGGESFSTLVTAQVASFGWLGQASPGHDKFDFTFRVNGGSEMAQFGGYAWHLGMIIDVGNTTWGGSWSSNFTNIGTTSSTSDVFVPEPSSYILTLVATAITLVVRPWRMKRRAQGLLVDRRDAEIGLDASRQM